MGALESKIYIGANKNYDVVKTSSSGGAFAAIVHEWFKEKKSPIVCGCILNENLDAVHVFSQSEEGCFAMRGSKYIMSDLDGAIKKTDDYLKRDFSVLFSGTPCQIYGLKNSLEKNGTDMTNLLTVEVICHGVAEKKFFKDYIHHLEKKYKANAVSVRFRSKRKSGNLQDMQVVFDNGRIYNASSTKYDWFYSLYNNLNLNLQKGCYSCRFANPERNADISLGDAWGKEENYGLSMIMVNSEKGFQVVSKIFSFMDIREAEDDEINRDRIFQSVKKPDNYEKFWEIYNENGYLAAQKYIGNNTIKGKVIDRIVYITNEMGIKKYIKKMIRRG